MVGKLPSRRNLLKSIGGTALVASSSSVISAKTPTVEIVTVRGKGGAIRQTKKVDEAWYNLEMKADKVRKNLESRFDNHPRFHSASIGVADELINGRKKPQITAFEKPKAGKPDLLSKELDLPSTIDGINVTQKVKEDIELDQCAEVVDRLQGGDALDEDDGNGPGSATCAVEESGSIRVMTAEHVVDPSSDPADCDSPMNDDMWNWDTDDNYIGGVVDYDKAQDWATVDEYNSDIPIGDSIRGEYGTLAGHETLDGLRDLKSTGETVYHRGWKTCTTTGQVTSVKVTDDRCGGSATSDDYVEVSTYTDGGDSGGPHYKTLTYNGNTYMSIIAPHRGGQSFGCGAYAINRDHPISFDLSNF